MGDSGPGSPCVSVPAVFAQRPKKGRREGFARFPREKNRLSAGKRPMPVIRRDLAAEYLFRARPSGSGFYRQEGRQAEPWKRTGRQRFEQREPAKNRTAVEVSRSPIPTIGEASPPKT